MNLRWLTGVQLCFLSSESCVDYIRKHQNRHAHKDCFIRYMKKRNISKTFPRILIFLACLISEDFMSLQILSPLGFEIAVVSRSSLATGHKSSV